MVGRYALFDEIASGGMATVHFGRFVGPVGFSRTVAIKRLHPQYAKDPQFVAMFLDEARLVARIRHPNVVPTLEVVQEADELLLVMEYVQGETFSRLLRKSRSEGQLPPVRIVATVLAGVLHGLHAAHEARGERGELLHIVHRDVSPQNILVGTDGVPRILDFGVAKATQRSQTTRDGQVKGKLGYMAREQILSDYIDRRCDIFSAGVVLWEALAGRRLFDGDSDVRIMQKILHTEVSPPRPGEDPEKGLDAICLRALRSVPSERFATAREMALAIEAASPLAPASETGAWVEQLAHEDVAARSARVAELESTSDVFVKPNGENANEARRAPDGQETMSERLFSSRTRHRRVVLAVVSAFVLLGVGAVSFKWLRPRPPAAGIERAAAPLASGSPAASGPIALPAPPVDTGSPAAPPPPLASEPVATSAPPAPRAKAVSRTSSPQTGVN